MGKHARKAYLQAIRTRYRQSDKLSKQTILDEFCEVCGYARKYAIRLLSRKSDTNLRRLNGLALNPNIRSTRSWSHYAESGLPATSRVANG